MPAPNIVCIHHNIDVELRSPAYREQLVRAASWSRVMDLLWAPISQLIIFLTFAELLTARCGVIFTGITPNWNIQTVTATQWEQQCIYLKWTMAMCDNLIHPYIYIPHNIKTQHPRLWLSSSRVCWGIIKTYFISPLLQTRIASRNFRINLSWPMKS